MDANLPNFDPVNPDHVREAFLEAIETERCRAGELTIACGRAPDVIEDAATAGKITDFIKQVQACSKAVEEKRKYHKTRYDACGKAVHEAATKITGDLGNIKKAMESRLTAYQRKVAEEERQRREDEARKAREEAEAKAATMETDGDLAEAERAAQEAEKAQQAAAAKASTLAQSRGAHGTSASLRTFWTHEVMDPAVIPLDVLRPYLGADVIDKAIRAFIRAGGRELKGVRIYEETQSVVR